MQYLEALAEKMVSFQEHTGLQLRLIADQTAIEKRVLTPSAACLTVNNADFTRLFGVLRLAEGEALSKMVDFVKTSVPSSLSKLSFKWTAQPNVSNNKGKEKSLEKVSYPFVVAYLKKLGLSACDVSEGQRCQQKLLFVSDVHSIRPNTVLDSSTLRKRSQCPFLIQQVRGKCDIVVVAAQYAKAVYFTKFQVRVAIEIKTPELMMKLDACLRECAVQLVGLNTENVERTPVVLLTNLEGKNYVLFLTMGPCPASELKYTMHILRFITFELALEFALLQSEKQPISTFFGKRPTPPPSEVSEASEDYEGDADDAEIGSYDTEDLKVSLC